MAARAKSQMELGEEVIEDKELEDLLEAREGLKSAAGAYRAADKKAKEAIDSRNLPMPFRIGRFVISESTVPARTVEFETVASTRVAIKNVTEEGA